jgi:hypothetical protein
MVFPKEGSSGIRERAEGTRVWGRVKGRLERGRSVGKVSVEIGLSAGTRGWVGGPEGTRLAEGSSRVISGAVVGSRGWATCGRLGLLEALSGVRCGGGGGQLGSSAGGEGGGQLAWGEGGQLEAGGGGRCSAGAGVEGIRDAGRV